MCNAGVMGTKERRETKQGLELQWGVNHIGHYVFVGSLIKMKPKRIVILSSRGHQYVFHKVTKSQSLL